MRVQLALALASLQEVLELELPEGATVADALVAARLAERHPGLDLAAMRTGIWSREVHASQRLREGDRVEIYRALRADPKEMRRKRARVRPSPRSRSGP